MTARRRWLRLAFVAAALLTSACGGDEEIVPDGTLLSALSTSQRTVLCEQFTAEAERADSQSCASDPSTSVVAEMNFVECEDFPAFTCNATAGDLRACWRATIADPCVPQSLRPACAPLDAARCGITVAAAP
jgi:hypothetical protein